MTTRERPLKRKLIGKLLDQVPKVLRSLLNRSQFGRKKKKLEKEKIQAEKIKENQKKGATKHQGISGRALFGLDPSLFVDDENAADDAFETRE